MINKKIIELIQSHTEKEITDIEKNFIIETITDNSIILKAELLKNNFNLTDYVKDQIIDLLSPGNKIPEDNYHNYPGHTCNS